MMLYPPVRQHGFNLIEMMIGVTVGLLGLVAAATIYVNFNKHRTVETSLMEAQSNGSMALFLLERDLDRAGYGFMAMQGCSCNYDPGSGATTQLRSFCEKFPSSPVQAHPVDPIQITDGGASGSDELHVRYGTPLGGLTVTSVLAKQVDPDAIPQDPAKDFLYKFKLKSTAGIVNGEILVLDRGGKCAAYQATAVSESDKTVSHDHSASNINPDPAPLGYEASLPNDVIYNLGHYVDKKFRVDSSSAQLLESTFPTYTNDTPVVDNIVYMKVDIGLDTGTDKLVDSWVKIVPTDYSKVLALRVGIVARTQIKDNDSPTPATLVVLPAVAGGTEQTYTVPDQKYRYKVYSTTIPLRNMLWN